SRPAQLREERCARAPASAYARSLSAARRISISSFAMSVIRRLAGPFFVFAGVMHFVIPRAYRRIMPPYVPAHMTMVYASGAAEIAGGAGLMLPRQRRRAG